VLIVALSMLPLVGFGIYRCIRKKPKVPRSKVFFSKEGNENAEVVDAGGTAIVKIEQRRQEGGSFIVEDYLARRVKQ